MKRINKRGQVFMVTLAIVTLILLIVAYVSLSHKYEFRTKDGLNEALEQYFESEQQKLIQKNQEDENAMTNLDFDEFWDDVELD